MFKTTTAHGPQALFAAVVVAFTLSLGGALVHTAGLHAEAGPAGYTWVDGDGVVSALVLSLDDDDDAAASLD